MCRPNTSAGDEITLRVALSDETPQFIETVQFAKRGWTLSQAAVSLCTEQMIGSPADEVVDCDSETLANLVSTDLIPSRLGCVELGVAVENAVKDRYQSQTSRSPTRRVLCGVGRR